ncbi:hypothetical protein HHK36_003118 [Tetracentron sinense]|uniref:Uncharacterized protein n=1 Tax=Tetracentron sinense TaxID=13715 RepID=A0A834ZX22_TETSI|nr:hypothetical protein HHK36_003118 [Tetracentron sinense]
MSRLRVEGLLEAFPKLVGTGKNTDMLSLRTCAIHWRIIAVLLSIKHRWIIDAYSLSDIDGLLPPYYLSDIDRLWLAYSPS